jgi:hypothetical protein
LDRLHTIWRSGNGKNYGVIKKISSSWWSGSSVEHLPSKCEALSSNHGTAQTTTITIKRSVVVSVEGGMTR